jgi:translocation and assembly module TamA
VTVRVVGEGRDFPAVQQALTSVSLATGQRLVHGDYEHAKQSLFDAAYDNGFLDAQWRRSEIRVAPNRRQADVALVLETGRRFYFGETTVQQQALDPSFVKGYVNVEAGTPYDIQQLLDLQATLNDTDYFSRVEVRAPRQAAGDDQRIPVTVVTEPANPQKYTVGLGFGTDTGPRGKLGVLVRRINDRGHRLRADLQVSAIEHAIGARYEIPIRNYATDRLAFTATARQEEIGDADTDQMALGASQIVSWLG